MKRLKFLQLILAAVILILTSAQTKADVPNPPANFGGMFGYLTGEGDPYDFFLSWDANNKKKDYDGFKVYYKEIKINEEDEEDFSVLLSTENEEAVVDQDDLNFTLRSYLFYVVAYNDDGESEISNYISTFLGRPYNEGDIRAAMMAQYVVITSDPSTKIRQNDKYFYDVNVFYDLLEENDLDINYELLQKPEGMVINNETGLIEWSPENEGSFSVEVKSFIPGSDYQNKQIWTIEVNSVSSVYESSLVNNLNFYPNPEAADKLNLSFSSVESGQVNIMIYDNSGNVVKNGTENIISGENNIRLELGNIPSGSYLVELRLSGKLLGTGNIIKL